MGGQEGLKQDTSANVHANHRLPMRQKHLLHNWQVVKVGMASITLQAETRWIAFGSVDLGQASTDHAAVTMPS